LTYRCGYYLAETDPGPPGPSGLATSSIKWCGAPATRFIYIFNERMSTIRPVCEVHVDQGASSRLGQKEVSEAEYIVWDVMNS
jgi:hypothetical protein